MSSTNHRRLVSASLGILFALTVAVSTSNSFLIKTHQVNALLMAPAGYRVVDFLRAGGIMTVLFCVDSHAFRALFS